MPSTSSAPRQSVSSILMSRLSAHTRQQADTPSKIMGTGVDGIHHFYYSLIMEESNAVAALAALAQTSRLSVFRLLVRAGPAGMAAGAISKETGIPPSSLSFHLKELLHADMVSSRHEGRHVIYTANFRTALNLIAFLSENCCAHTPCDCESGSDTPNGCCRNKGQHRNHENKR